MPLLARKHQIISIIEDVEGVAKATVTGGALASGAIGHEVLSPTNRRNIQMIDRNASSLTLSNPKDVVGRMSRTIGFGYDLRGSGTATTAPDWAHFLRACAFREATLSVAGCSVLTIGAITAGPFVAGTTVTGGTSGATGVVIATTYTGNTRLFLRSVTGTFTVGGETVTSGGVTAASSAASTTGLVYRPDSVIASTVTTSGAWAGGPAVLGETLTGGTSGAKGILRGGTLSGTPGSLQIEMVIGTGAYSTAETLTGSVSGATIALHATPAVSLLWTPSLSIRSNFDGLTRDIRGARGNVQMRLAAGEPARLDFEMQGCLVDAVDTALVTSVTYPSTDFLRFVSAQCSVDGLELPLSEVAVNMQNTVGMRPDPSLAHGVRSYVVGARAPTVTIDPEMMLAGSYDWESKLRNATSISLLATLGTAAGNRIDVAMPALQVDDLSDADRDGAGVDQVTLKLRRSAVSGDDEIYLFHT